jgi:yecA family protein
MGSSMPPASPEALSDDEFDALAELLDAYSPFDTDGLLGLLHAVVVAPGLLLPSTWFPVLVPHGLAEAASARDFIGLVMRQYNDVADALAQNMAIMPEPDDAEGCEAFAAGYIAGAEVDPEWIKNADRWTFAAPFAYLAGRLDLISDATIADVEQNLAPDPRQILRREMAATVRAANDSFKEYRQAAPPTRTVTKAIRVGRNEPCPCGSGKKFKRCCVDRRETGPSN